MLGLALHYPILWPWRTPKLCATQCCDISPSRRRPPLPSPPACAHTASTQNNSDRQNHSDVQVLFSATLAAVQHQNPPSQEQFYGHYLFWTAEMADCFPIRDSNAPPHTAAGDNMKTVFVWVRLRSQGPWLPFPREHIKNKIKKKHFGTEDSSRMVKAPTRCCWITALIWLTLA